MGISWFKLNFCEMVSGGFLFRQTLTVYLQVTKIIWQKPIRLTVRNVYELIWIKSKNIIDLVLKLYFQANSFIIIILIIVILLH